MANRMMLVCLFLVSHAYAGDEAWLSHYIAAEKAFSEKNGAVAVEEYTKAIQLAPEKLFLYLERARTYEKKHKYAEAIHDFTKVIDTQGVHNQYLIPALWGRSRMYLRLDDYDLMEKDCDRVIAIDPDNLDSEITEDYLIMRNIRSEKVLDSEFQQEYVSSLVELGLAEAEGALFTENGVAILKKNKTFPCHKCQLREKKSHSVSSDCPVPLKSFFRTQRYNNPNNETKETDCNYWCKRLTKSAKNLCEGFKTTKCRIACREVVDLTKKVCLECCADEGFYKNCVKPFETFMEMVGCEEPIW